MTGEGLFSLVILIIICALIALLGHNRKIGYGWSLFLCIFLSPIIGIIIILCSKKNNNREFINMD